MKKRRKWHCIINRIRYVLHPVGAEIGVHQGELSRQLLKRHRGLTLYMVDMWSHDTYSGKGEESAKQKYIELYQDECELNLQKTKDATAKYKKRRRIIQGDSALSADDIQDASLDFVFIDADHSYEGCLRDIKAWLPKVKSGGYICGHDYPRYPGVVQAVDETFGDRVELDSDHCWFVRL